MQILKKHGILLFVVGLMFCLIPFFLQYAVFSNNIFSKVTNDGWASFLGSYLGGVIAGIGTLAAVLVSKYQTEKVQEQHRQEIIFQEKTIFVNSVVDVTSKYMTDICVYYYQCRAKLSVKKRFDGEPNKKVKARIRKELDNFNINRRIAIECYFSLELKLKGINEADNLLKQLKYVHNGACMDEEHEQKFFEDAIDKLKDETSNFVDAYKKRQ